MIIDEILLKNYRCYQFGRFSFDSKLNVIVGSNATGKTTILESINCLSITKSYRCIDQNELIKENESYFYLEGTVSYANKKEKIVLYRDKNGCQVKKNNYKYKKNSEYLGFFNTVVFSATDFLTLKGGPKEKRNLIDLIICQISKDYISVSNYYKKLLKERNALLKRLYFENNSKLQVLLDVISNRMMEYGAKIIETRAKFIDKISKLASDIHLKISDNTEKLEIHYSPSVKVEDYLIELNKALVDDKKRGATSVGPHRDDCIFIINNKNIASYGSQGQQRNALLSVKLAMAELIFEEKGEEPVVLLDDVFSELDKNRQNALISCLNPAFQTIITAASISDVNDLLLKKAKIIKIEKKE